MIHVKISSSSSFRRCAPYWSCLLFSGCMPQQTYSLPCCSSSTLGKQVLGCLSVIVLLNFQCCVSLIRQLQRLCICRMYNNVYTFSYQFKGSEVFLQTNTQYIILGLWLWVFEVCLEATDITRCRFLPQWGSARPLLSSCLFLVCFAFSKSNARSAGFRSGDAFGLRRAVHFFALKSLGLLWQHVWVSLYLHFEALSYVFWSIWLNLSR